MKKKTFDINAGDVSVRPKDISNLWEGDWEIVTNDTDKIVIGTLSFAGEKALGAIPMRIDIPDVHYHNRGYGTQAIRAMKEWAFYHKDIFEITAVIEHENSAAITAFQKAGFVFRDGTRTIENYSALKQKTSWLGLYFCIGIVIGLILAAVTTLTWVSLIVSVGACLAVGAAMDAKENIYRNKVMGKRGR